MSRGWQDMRKELRLPRTTSRVWWLCQNLTGSVVLRIIGGTIGWRPAYSLLRGIASMASRGTLPFEETGVDSQPVLGKELGVGVARAESCLGMAHLTYRGLVRQIRGMHRVAMPKTRAAAEIGGAFPSPLRYRYWSPSRMGMFLEEFRGRLRKIRVVTIGVNA